MVATKARIAVIFHMYYQDLMGEIVGYINNLSKAGLAFDTYVTLTHGSAHNDQTRWVQDQLLCRLPSPTWIYTLPNKGTDNGPFLCCMGHIMEAGREYDYVVKVHTKKSLLGSSKLALAQVWRTELLDPILGSPEKIKAVLKIFNTRKDVGMVAARRHITSHMATNKAILADYQKLFGLPKPSLFVGGNMFWIRFKILKHFLSKVDTLKIYQQLEEGYVTDAKGGTHTHSLERVWGYMVTNYNQRICGVE